MQYTSYRSRNKKTLNIYKFIHKKCPEYQHSWLGECRLGDVIYLWQQHESENHLQGHKDQLWRGLKPQHSLILRCRLVLYACLKRLKCPSWLAIITNLNLRFRTTGKYKVREYIAMSRIYLVAKHFWIRCSWNHVWCKSLVIYKVQRRECLQLGTSS